MKGGGKAIDDDEIDNIAYWQGDVKGAGRRNRQFANKESAIGESVEERKHRAAQ